MASNSNDNITNKRVAKNTMFLYIRMFFAIIVGLYTSRVVLAILGVEDYGIYSVVGSIVAMMGFLNSAMSASTSRFITYELGTGDEERMKKAFSCSIIVHCLIALFVLVVAETIGLWFLCNKLVIPEERMFAAHCVYQLSIISAMLGITQVPYNACIIAHEKIDIYSYVEIVHIVLKLLIVYLLLIGNFDKLILYAILLFAVSFLILMVYRIYGMSHFNECRFRWKWDNEYIRPLLSFTGWSLYPNLCFTSRQQGINFILNIFGTAVVNAASGLATTIFNIVEQFSNNILTAARPPIIKLYAKGEYDATIHLMKDVASVAGILYGLVAVPVIFECHFLLSVWLRWVPDYTEGFCQLLVLASFFNLNNSVLYMIMQANGNIKRYSILAGTTAILVLPALWVMLKLGYSLHFAYILSLINSCIIFCYCLYNVKHIFPGFQVIHYTVLTILRNLLCFLPAIVVIFLIRSQMEESWQRFIFSTGASTLIIGLIGIVAVVPKSMRDKMKAKFHS